MVLKGGVVLPPCGQSGTAAAGVHWYMYLLLNHWCQRIDYAVWILQHNVWFKIIKFGVFTSSSAVLWSSLCLTADSWKAHEQGSEPPVAPDWRRLRWFWAAPRSDRVRVTLRTKFTLKGPNSGGLMESMYTSTVPECRVTYIHLVVYNISYGNVLFTPLHIFDTYRDFLHKKTWCSIIQPMCPAVYGVLKCFYL